MGIAGARAFRLGLSSSYVSPNCVPRNASVMLSPRKSMRQRARPATPASRASLRGGQRDASVPHAAAPSNGRDRSAAARVRAAARDDAAPRRAPATQAAVAGCVAPEARALGTGGARRGAVQRRGGVHAPHEGGVQHLPVVCAALGQRLRGGSAPPLAEWRRALRSRTAWGRPRVAAAPALPAAVEDMAKRCREPAHAVTAGERAADLDRGLGPWPAATCLRFASPPPAPAKRNATRQRAAVMRRR